MRRFEKAAIVIAIFFLVVLFLQFFYFRFVVMAAENTSLSESSLPEEEPPQQEEIAIEVIREDDQKSAEVSENAINEADSSGGDPNDSVSDTSPVDDAEVLDALKEINTSLVALIVVLSFMVGCNVGFEIIKWVKSW